MCVICSILTVYSEFILGGEGICPLLQTVTLPCNYFPLQEYTLLTHSRVYTGLQYYRVEALKVFIVQPLGDESILYRLVKALRTPILV